MTAQLNRRILSVCFIRPGVSPVLVGYLALDKLVMEQHDKEFIGGTMSGMLRKGWLELYEDGWRCTQRGVDMLRAYGGLLTPANLLPPIRRGLDAPASSRSRVTKAKSATGVAAARRTGRGIDLRGV
jgi:hypothetical protein